MKRATPTPSQNEIDAIASRWIVRRDAGLAPAEEAEFQRWQRADPRHADAIARKDEAWKVFERPRRSGQADLLLQRLTQRAATRRRRRLGGAAALVVLLLATAMFMRFKPAMQNATAVASQGSVITPETRTLPDASVVELRPGAELTVEFSTTHRRVVLTKGEAFFQVAKDAARPFVVSAGAVDVRAVGTAFSVQLASSKVEVLVTEGTVGIATATTTTATAGRSSAEDNRMPEADLTSGRNTAAADPIGNDASTRQPELPRVSAAPVLPAPQTVPADCLADAGHRVVVELNPRGAAAVSAPQLAAISADEISERLAWRAPRLEFSELPLGEAAALMSRHSGVQFVFHEPALAGLRLSGVVRADNVETFVRLLEGTCGIVAQRTGNTIRLRQGP